MPPTAEPRAVTAQDVTRRDAIAEYGLIGRPPEPDLEGLVQLAATLCDVPTAVINIIDDHAQHQVAAVGFQPSVCAREDSMCAAVLDDPRRVVVSDARTDARFADNPFVTGEIGNVRFYASSPLITPAGVAIGTLCVFDEETGDLTPQHSRGLDLLAHQVVDVLELRRITRELGQSNDQLRTFAGQISHDLRNPLTALTGFIELAADSPELADAPQATRALARAESAASRMDSMISDLLDYARIGGQVRHTPVQLDELARTVLEDLDAALVQSGTEVDVDAGIQVSADATLLRVLLQNLVANAVKFSSAAGVVPRVAIGAVELAGGWRVTVDDNGPGIPAADRERVFELMERGQTGGVPGLGIGLSTCRRIVEAHRGLIGIEDSPLGGTRVWVVLPATS
ncbi:sensor histidine kinase [Microbacterium terricola]|uniref:sensor histidine kinase n=1 Tax=Microbacterium terricola TaxID=344163 RepID=UPI0021E9779E|nr:GAF domain-containing sensor histidine kinase [Microbacterium terricola]UYK39152.1 GAF domain-containing sensor histidine kinase [Microbacterium terricola]